MLLLRRLFLGCFLTFGFMPQAFSDPEREMAERCLKDANKREQSSQILAFMTSLPTPPVVPLQEPEGLHYQTSSAVFGRILGTSAQATVLNDIEELRFLPYTLTGTPLLLVIRSAGAWTPEKARKVVSVAKTQENSISIVWLSEMRLTPSLKALAVETGGRAFEMRDLNRLVLRHVCSR